MKLSIIIPTKNESKYLPYLLSSISKQTVDFRYEIIIADADSSDSTKEIASNYGCRITQWGLPGIGRNKWAKIAQGEILLFLDADVTLRKNSLATWINGLHEGNADIGTPYCRKSSEEESLIGEIYYSSSYITYWLWCAFWGCILIKRKLFEKIWGFDEEMYVMEDVDLVARAKRYWKRINLTPPFETSTRRLKNQALKLMAFSTWWYIQYVFWYKHIESKKNKEIYPF